MLSFIPSVNHILHLRRLDFLTIRDYDHAVNKKRNEIERLFRGLKGFRRIFSDFEKLDVLFLGFLLLRTHRRGPAQCELAPGFLRCCPFFEEGISCGFRHNLYSRPSLAQRDLRFVP